MKPRFAVAIVLFVSLVVVASTNIAQAQWSALNSGYAVTTNWHGQDVPIGESVTATAGTTDSAVTEVEFRWINATGDIRWTVMVESLWTDGSIWDPDGDGVGPLIRYAQDNQTPDSLGDWGVQAIFHGPDTGKIEGKNSDIIRIRATSFFEIPQVPFGTIAILLSMFAALGVFIKRKRSLHSGI